MAIICMHVCLVFEKTMQMSEIDDLPELGQKMLRHDMLASNLYTSVVTDKFKTAFQNEYKQGVLKV